jgi:hypothetical protein
MKTISSFDDRDTASIAAELEARYQIRLRVEPLTVHEIDHVLASGRDIKLRGAWFDNHAYVRLDQSGHVVYLSDHAGRHARPRQATHITRQVSAG